MDIDPKNLTQSYQTDKQYFYTLEPQSGCCGEQNSQHSQTLLCFTKKSSNKQDNSDQQIDVIPLKKKVNGIKKNKNKKRKQKYALIIIKQIPNSEDVVQLSTFFKINNQGFIKLGFQIEHLSFGFEQTQFTNFLKNEQIFQVILLNASQKPRVSVEYALNYIQHTPCKQIQEVRNALFKYKLAQQQIFNVIDCIDKNEQQIQLINEEVQKHIKSCNEYVKQISQESKQMMFSYLIGRINFEIKDIEIVQAGYSKSFLELIGLNESSLSFLLMRNQRIDIIKDQDEVMMQQLMIFQNNNFQNNETKLSFKVKTFDGFDIQLYITKKQISPSYQAKKFSNLPREYIFIVSEFDVKLEDLENLISYRQKILNKNQLTFDEFINKEISILFENVEYSVYSQSLIEKFYQNNLNQLQIIKDLKIKCKKQKNYL
ncbi:hypothetical protein ABPG73_006453 [Tetrahymena malaccensis]